MTLVRQFELRAIQERRDGLIPGFIHSCVGQEATAVGACLALEPDDVITSTHRGHGHLIGKGGDPRYMMTELAAEAVRQANLPEHLKVTVLFDAYYLCPTVVRAVLDRSWHYIGVGKSNRRFEAPSQSHRLSTYIHSYLVCTFQR